MNSIKNRQAAEFLLTLITVITIIIYLVRILLPDSSRVKIMVLWEATQ
jgi:hypothetical protein